MPISTSQRDFPRYSRTNPRPMRCHSYFSSACICRASISAILFSKPSRFRLEKGKLFGSAHTFSSRASDAIAHTSTTNIAAHLGKRKHIKHASLVGVLRQVLHRADKTECCGS